MPRSRNQTIGAGPLLRRWSGGFPAAALRCDKLADEDWEIGNCPLFLSRGEQAVRRIISLFSHLIRRNFHVRFILALYR